MLIEFGREVTELLIRKMERYQQSSAGNMCSQKVWIRILGAHELLTVTATFNALTHSFPSQENNAQTHV